ncbi:Cyclin-dependent kinase inhibitor 6 [Hirschfeldia incana]|nr:Cyclin-dependent kinase inhibitor 6 [Hirschfeldia incana]
MSERNLNSKRESRELEASITSVSPLKKKTKLDDSSPDSHGVVLAIPSPSVASTQDRCSITSDDDDKSSGIVSGCFSSESNETVRNNPASVIDLEEIASEALGETTETESSSSAIKRDKPPPEVSKIPTAEEIEAFLSELEGGDDDRQKRFIEK